MQLSLPGIAVQLFARVFSAGEINGNCLENALIKNSGATIKKRRPGVMFFQCIQYGCTGLVRFIALLLSSVVVSAHSSVLLADVRVGYG